MPVRDKGIDLITYLQSTNVLAYDIEQARIKPMMLHVKMETAEDGWVVVECPALPGCVSQGRDEKEALENIREAITAWLWAEDQKAVKNLPGTSVLVAV